MAETIAQNFASVQRKINAACERADRERSEVTLVAISKTFPAFAVDEAIEAGASDIGENRVQEAEVKFSKVERQARFHLVGHLQSNKSKLAVSLFDVIQTVDSVKLGRRLNDAADNEDEVLEILMQVNVGEEEQKYGVSPQEARGLAIELERFERLDLKGLMTIPPVADEQSTRRYFQLLRALRDQIRNELGRESFSQLSMGMSDDYEIAIDEGATIVRVGSAIFGSRDR